MTRHRRPVSPWLRASVLIALLAMTVAGLPRMIDGDTVERMLGLVSLTGCLGLFVVWWRTPTSDSTMRSSDDRG